MNISRPAKRLRRAAAAILLLGCLSAIVAYAWVRPTVEPAEFGSGSIAETREMQQLERLGGKASVLILKFQVWFESLWHGPRLAITLLVMSILVAALCLHLASLADEEGDPQ